MKKIIKAALLLAVAFAATSCFDDYLYDYETPNMGFSLNKQVRTVVSTTNQIYVGVSIGGKREVDMNDWACFTLDETLLTGTGKEMLPEHYYELSDPNMFKVRKPNMAIADVGITFTDDFYADAKSLTGKYALPFRLIATSIAAPADSLGNVNPYGSIRVGGETAIVAIKYISGLSGTYYRVGSEVEVDAQGEVIGTPFSYEAADLMNNATVACTTLAKYDILRPGLGNSTMNGLKIGLTPDAGGYSVSLEGDGATITNASGTYVAEGDYALYSSDTKAPQFNLEYTYEVSGRYYKVSEKLVLRQFAERELRVETF